MSKSVVTKANLGSTIDIGILEDKKINVKIDQTTIVKAADGTLSVDLAALDIKVISDDPDNLIQAGADGGAWISAEEVQDAIGAAILANSGLTYDDTTNAIKAAVAGLVGGTGETATTTISDVAGVPTIVVEIVKDAVMTDNLLSVSTDGIGISAEEVLGHVEANIGLTVEHIRDDPSKVRVVVGDQEAQLNTELVTDIFDEPQGYYIKLV